MLIETRIIQNSINKKGNISFEQLVQYFKMHRPPPQDGLVTETDFAEECIRVTDGASEYVSGDADPFLIPKKQNDACESIEVNSKILILK